METLLYERNSAFDHNLWDRYEYLQLMSLSNRLQMQHEAGYLRIGYSAVQDAFYALAGGLPNQSPAGKAWGEVIEQEYFPKLQERMKDRDSKINTTLFLAKKFVDHYLRKETKEEQQKREEQDQNQQQDREDKDNSQDNGNEGDTDQDRPTDLSPSAKRSGKETPQEIQEAMDQLEKQAENGEGDTEASGQAGPQHSQKIVNKQEVLQITDEELEELDKENETYEIMGGLLPGTGMGPRETRLFTEQNYQHFELQKVAELIGWAQRVMDAATRSNQGAVGEFTGYKQDGWSANVHPVDRELVASGSLLGRAKLADRQLNTRIFDEDKPAGKGAAVLLTDESTSMNDPTSVSPLPKRKQAINLKLSLAHFFQKEDRPFVDIAWCAHGHRTYEFGTPGVVDHLTTHFSGGTMINDAMAEALDWIDDRPEYRSQADILVITDGEIEDNPYDDQFLWNRIKEYKERGGRIWLILLDVHIPQNYYFALTQWTDGIVEAKDLYREDGLANILTAMAKDRREYEQTLV